VLEELFDISTFNIFSDDANYYFFRALNNADNNDLNNSIILDSSGNIRRIRTNRERFEGIPNYAENDEITLEEVVSHIKMHQSKDTNCISLTSNANTALTYGRGYYKDKYIIVKIPKTDLNNKVYQAGLYMINEINKRINVLYQSLSEEQKYLLDLVSNAKTEEQLNSVRKLLPIGNRENDMFEGGLEFKLTNSFNYSSLNREQNLEKNKIILKLDILNKQLLLKISNKFLIQTIGNAFSSLELIHYKDINKENIIEIPKEIIDILGLIQQLPSNLKYLDEMRKSILEKINNIKFIEEFNYQDYRITINQLNLDSIYKLTNGKVDYKTAMEMYKKAFYLAKSKLRTKNSVDILRQLLNNDSKYSEILNYMEENTYGIEPEITTRLNKDYLSLSESVSLIFIEKDRKLFDFISKLNVDDLNYILNNPMQSLKYLLNNFLDENIEAKSNTKEDWYANSIIDLLNLKELGVNQKLNERQRNDIIDTLKRNNFLVKYNVLKSMGISDEKISYLLFANLIKEKSEINLHERFTLEELEWFIGYNRIKNTNLVLKNYQKDALNNIDNAFLFKQFTSAIMPTGTGKSFVALAEMYEHKEKQILYLAPNIEILNQLKQIIIKAFSPEQHLGETDDDIIKRIFPGLTLSTYQNLLSENSNSVINKKYDLIVLDELHRAGASEWRKQIDILLNNQDKYTKILGITATPERDVDLKDMTEYFAKKYGYTDEEIIKGKHLAINMSIIDAIRLGIIPNPKVINCEYSLITSGTLDELRVSIDDIANEEVKTNSIKKYEKLRREVENSNGIEEILNDNLRSDGKYIVFLPITKRGDREYEDEDGNKIDKSSADRIIKDYQTLIRQYIYSYEYLNNSSLLEIYKKIDNGFNLSIHDLEYLESEKENILLLSKIDIKGKPNALNTETNIIANNIIKYMKWERFSREIQTKKLTLKTKDKIDSYSMLGSYSDKKNEDNLREFNKKTNNRIKLMFVMNKLNEGVHVDNISGIIWLRPIDSNSRILFLQQLGRCISAINPGKKIKDENIPIVLDLVNNTLQVKLDKGEQIEQRDLNRLLLAIDWINANSKFPNLDGYDSLEKNYATTLKQVHDNYIKYIENEELLEDENINTKILIKEIIKVGSDIGLWNMNFSNYKTLKNYKKKELSSNELLSLFKLNAISRNFVELNEEINSYDLKAESVIRWVNRIVEYCETYKEWPKKHNKIKKCSDGTTSDQLVQWLTRTSKYTQGEFKYENIKTINGTSVKTILDNLSSIYIISKRSNSRTPLDWVNNLAYYCETYHEWPKYRVVNKTCLDGTTSDQLINWLNQTSGYTKNSFKYINSFNSDGINLKDIVDSLYAKYARGKKGSKEVFLLWVKNLEEYCETYKEWPKQHVIDKVCKDGTTSDRLSHWVSNFDYNSNKNITDENGIFVKDIVDSLYKKYAKTKRGTNQSIINYVENITEYCETYKEWPKQHVIDKICKDGTTSNQLAYWLNQTSGYTHGQFKYNDIINENGVKVKEILDELYDKYKVKTKTKKMELSSIKSA